MSLHSILCITLLTSGLLGYQSNQQLADYASNTSTLDPRAFFDGQLCARGVVKNHRGNVIRTLNARIHASWQQTNGVSIGTLDEVFVFRDIATNKPSKETRVWTLRHTTPRTLANGISAQHSYIATASDVVGESLLNASGNSINMSYILRYAQPDKRDKDGQPKTIDLRMDDWMYLVNPTTIINTTKMKKFGITVGEVVLSIQKSHPDQSCI